MPRAKKHDEYRPIPLEEVISELPLDEQKEIERLTRQYIAEELMLRDLRKKLDITQDEMADALEVGQDSISRLEKRSDVLVSTLAGYINALGGTLDLVARFPDRPAVSLAGLKGLAEVAPKQQARAGKSTTAFKRYIGIDYSGAKTPTSRLNGLQIYMAEGSDIPKRVPIRAPLPSKHWTRRETAEWLMEILAEDTPTLVGIDHGFSFPVDYFERHGVKRNWSAFLDDFHEHWPTDGDAVWVRDILDSKKALKRSGERNWRRTTEKCTPGTQSVFNFGVQGEVATSTHAGLPWLLAIRKKFGDKIHFWPFDGWEIPKGKSAIAEVYPSLWSRSFLRENRTEHEHDAFVVARWFSIADMNGKLKNYLNMKNLPPDKRKLAQNVEGWILGVEWKKNSP